MKLTKYTIIFLWPTAAFFLCGCMQLKAVPHMDELLTLKAYSDEKEAQSQWVDGKRVVFEQLLSAVKNGSVKSYSNQDAVTAQFGAPVLSGQAELDGRFVTRWLYRHPIQKLASDRVYLYFDQAGHLVKFEHVPSSAASRH